MREGELVAELDGATSTELAVLRHAMPGTQSMVYDPDAEEEPEPDAVAAGAGAAADPAPRER
jgi:hypothetical protein